MAGVTISDALFTDIKAELGITWQDDVTERKVGNYIRSGMTYLNGKLGEPADYEADGYPRTLLFEYVRYARDGALDVFENNYLSMILAMQNKRAVKLYAENSVPSDQ